MIAKSRLSWQKAATFPLSPGCTFKEYLLHRENLQDIQILYCDGTRIGGLGRDPDGSRWEYWITRGSLEPYVEVAPTEDAARKELLDTLYSPVIIEVFGIDLLNLAELDELPNQGDREAE